MTAPQRKLRISRTQIALVLITIVAVYGVVPQLGNFHGSLQVLRRPDWGFVILAIGLFLGTYAAAAGTYLLLAFRRLNYVQVVEIQIASMFVGRLVPAGLGTLGANFAYLRHSKHSTAQSAAVLSVNNLLGVVGHGIIVLGALIAFPRSRMLVRTPHLGISHTVVVIGLVLLVVAVGVAIWLGKRRIRAAWRDLKRQLLTYRQRKSRVLAGLMTSVALTTANILCFYACCQALQVDTTILAAVLIFSLGIGLGTSTPTPGGIGGTEAGLVAGLLATGAPSATAVAAVLLYRLITYWLALVLGAIAFIDCQRRGLFSNFS